MKENRLSKEKSPYLLQHARNPVDWFPWGEEAFQKAKDEGKPVFLSIGYSTCHWCHVMERESFEDEAAAKVLNDRYVSVKVDREERPDIDQVYMRVCQTLNGQGGWPLTVILTPDKEPFFAATYLPKLSGGGRTGLIDLLNHAADLWNQNPSRLTEAAGKLKKALELSAGNYPGGSGRAFEVSIFGMAAAEMTQRFDHEFGGFGDAPKFPAPHGVTYLLRRHRQTGSQNLKEAALTTLDAMRAGGLWDHAGFGFHRYSTDRRWFLPHFEKMLYDQAGLANAYLEAYQLTGLERYKGVALDILRYVGEELSDPEGGFYCGEDADSEGVEGLFYLWTEKELREVLGSAAQEFIVAFGATSDGNYAEEATGERSGHNILFCPDRALWHENAAKFAGELNALKSVRAKRVRPHKDDKILSGWTAFMASAFLRTGAALNDAALVARGEKAIYFIERKMVKDGGLLRRYRDGEGAVGGFAEDYAWLGRACLDLHRATGNAASLESAEKWLNLLAENFSAPDGGLFDSSLLGEELLFRPREATDGAAPSAASVALECFARLHLLGRGEKWQELAKKLVEAESGLISRFPSAFSHFLQGAMLLFENTKTLTVHGRKGNADCEELLQAARSAYAPETEILFVEAVGPAKASYCDWRACLGDLDKPEEVRAVLAKGRAD